MFLHKRHDLFIILDRSSALGSLEVSHSFHHATAHPIVYWKNNIYTNKNKMRHSPLGYTFLM
jgi:hypothetical protein